MLKDECRSERNTGTLSGGDTVGMAGGGVQASQAIAEGDSGFAAIAWLFWHIGAGGGCDYISPAVCDYASGGAANARLKGARQC